MEALLSTSAKICKDIVSAVMVLQQYCWSDVITAMLLAYIMAVMVLQAYLTRLESLFYRNSSDTFLQT